MKEFKKTITLNRNSRGCYIIDTIKGCSVCAETKPRGCYGDCYAKNIAARYRIDFTNPIKRGFSQDKNQLYFMGFEDLEHESRIIREIKNINMPFVRIGEMGDPSEDWQHTLNVCKSISMAGKPIVIITKHWKIIPEALLQEVKRLNLCINTSISALDSDAELSHRLVQYNRLKQYCISVLRIVSCDFNLQNTEGKTRAIIQERLFENDKIIDTVFRPNPKNPLVLNGIINTKKVQFLGVKMLASVYRESAYLGWCMNCPDMCGITL